MSVTLPSTSRIPGPCQTCLRPCDRVLWCCLMGISRARAACRVLRGRGKLHLPSRRWRKMEDWSHTGPPRLARATHRVLSPLTPPRQMALCWFRVRSSEAASCHPARSLGLLFRAGLRRACRTHVQQICQVGVVHQVIDGFEHGTANAGALLLIVVRCVLVLLRC
jgi:hypothetical protein